MSPGDEERLRAARSDRDRLRREVLEWMDAEAKEARIRQNSQAPKWFDYSRSEDALARLRDELGV